MRALKLCVGFVLVTLVGALAYLFNDASRAALRTKNAELSAPASSANETGRPVVNLSNHLAIRSYRLDASQSKFIAHARRGGLLWFKGHDHLVAVREFTGTVQLDPDSLSGSSLQLTAKTASMEETSRVFTDQQKKIINKELREIVLLPDKYPEIIFRSTSVTGKAEGANQYDLKIAGDLTLNGVTRQVTIPARVTVSGSDLRAQGEFGIDRSDFKVKATSAVDGLIRVQDKVKFEFDMVGRS
jgi:polyisoprenoid-binding protein YceI